MGVIGGGAWGTALARHCAHMRHDTLLWAREPEVVAGVNDPAVKENATYLKVCVCLNPTTKYICEHTPCQKSSGVPGLMSRRSQLVSICMLCCWRTHCQ